MWPAILLASLGCYAEKIAGYLLPQRALDARFVHHVAALLPVALLAAIVAVQAVTSGRAIAIDARLPGMAVGIVLMSRRANFLVMVLCASATTAAVRHFGLLP